MKKPAAMLSNINIVNISTEVERNWEKWDVNEMTPYDEVSFQDVRCTFWWTVKY